MLLTQLSIISLIKAKICKAMGQSCCSETPRGLEVSQVTFCYLEIYLLLSTEKLFLQNFKFLSLAPN